MKYVSLLIFLIAMKWTWAMTYDTSTLPTQIHVDIQNDLKNYITEYINKNLPSASNIVFEKIWTENLKKNQVKANFSYSFLEENNETGNAAVALEGYAILNRVVNPKEETYDFWSFDELYILNDHIEFEEGITIRSGKEE